MTPSYFIHQEQSLTGKAADAFQIRERRGKASSCRGMRAPTFYYLHKWIPAWREMTRRLQCYRDARLMYVRRRFQLVVVRLILTRRSAAYINTAIGRLVFVSLFSFLVGKTGNPAYALILLVLGFGEMWTLGALAVDLRELLSGVTAKTVA